MSLTDSPDTASRSALIAGIGVAILLVAGWTLAGGLKVFPYAFGFAGLLIFAQGLRGLSKTVEGLWRGIAGLVVIWIGFFALTSSVPSPNGPFQVIIGVVMVIAWIGLPALLYMDAQQVSRENDWGPWWPAYVIPSIIPLINVVPGILYLLRRHQKVGVP